MAVILRQLSSALPLTEGSRVILDSTALGAQVNAYMSTGKVMLLNGVCVPASCACPPRVREAQLWNASAI
jgi:hypothetical protein